MKDGSCEAARNQRRPSYSDKRVHNQEDFREQQLIAQAAHRYQQKYSNQDERSINRNVAPFEEIHNSYDSPEVEEVEDEQDDGPSFVILQPEMSPPALYHELW